MRPASSVIREVLEETESVRTLRLDHSFDPLPGQYMMLWVRGVDEIPMSFSGPDLITVQRVGPATRAIFSLDVGDSVGVRGPLGTGFSLTGRSALLIGGGVGVAPLAFLGERARAVGMEVTSLLGFRSTSEAVFLDRFRRLGRVVLTTDDGSEGICGHTSAGLCELDPSAFDQIYLCGPEVMMWDVIRRCQGMESRIQACISRYIKCAIGVCGSCCIDPDGIRVCVEGPVIRADRLTAGEFGRYRRGPSGGPDVCKSVH
ncbi:MAG: Sulfhydrogenase 2 subunit gamma [Methanosaeta sp. PtaB.Bin039]|nr:MAG: Sulfhydrogenase 2 subunit gamma [Methanosaeta sp. PtaB.Bin039]OPY44486.1 MAG: Sulfhydrogenase 2 subunit gamma [Methanosaeta sp. PtaU1.Bin028]HOT07661.1 dihydroorotate dehydrogenase electron transfer subunit [Methanotrichaceae archaeon]HQF15919.1 dihydroorotate dehydrogenase electron transfer subunit [Methanotrichaceae archaeon]HQI90733.1 dihydroorotate dehydrogenase electron transfer subunit [Methanotrichaceae archaeon]